MRLIQSVVMATGLLLPTISHADSATQWITETLKSKAATLDQCTSEYAAIKGTINRIQNLSLPDTGKVIVVNIASGVVTAYQDGTPVIESRAVVGKESTPTPELDNQVTFVRPNPTWTVPQSIISRKGWRQKLAEDPQFFEDSGFDVIVNGQTLSPFDASGNADAVETFVQRPGENNALGAVKIGLDNSQAIYLHDTNDPGKFDDEVRSASAGCVRIQKVREIAAWVLDVPVSELDQMIADGDTTNHPAPQPVRVILGYWTAWPDENEHVRFYPDIYNKDHISSQCQAEVNSEAYSADEVPSDHSSLPVDNGPRFIPDSNGSEGNPEPVWTEYQLR